MVNAHTKNNFRYIVNQIRQVLPNSFSQEDEPEDFNHVFIDVTNNVSIGVLFLNTTSQGAYYELDEYTFNEIDNAETFDSEEKLLNYIEENYN